MPASITPVQLAAYAGRELPDRERGALLVEGTPDGGLVLGLFGNDRCRSHQRANREVGLVRRWLTAAGARHLGFGVSPDGRSWAMLLWIDCPYHTPPGRAFYAEMAVAEVEEELDRAWRAAGEADCGPTPGRRAG
jgi:hypothetical protein